jgi:glycosyltransferase involved in cell wall biosynthesis
MIQGRTILITTIYYAPETFGNAPYVTGLAEHLAAKGARVVVATTFPHYPQWHVATGTPPLRRDHDRGVTIRRRRSFVPRRQSAARRAAYELSFLAAGTTAIGLGSAPDAIIGVSPSLSGALLAAAAAKVYRRPYGLVFQDLMGRAADQIAFEGGGRLTGAIQRVERRLARRAAAVGVVSAGFRAYFESAGTSPERILHLRNWSHAIDEPDETRAEARLRLGWDDDDFVALHSGNIGRKQGLDNVVDAAAHAPDIRFVIAGEGNDRARLEAHARTLALPNLQFLPVQRPGRYEALLRAADVLLVNQRPTVVDMSLPSRLTSYFAAGRPVVAAVDGASETAAEILGSGGGLVVDAGDPRGLAAALDRLRRDGELAASLGMQARRYADTVLSQEAALGGYLSLVEQILESPAA